MGPGELIAINYQEKKFYQSDELKKLLSQRQNYSEWNKKTIDLDSILADKQISHPNKDIDQKFYTISEIL